MGTLGRHAHYFRRAVHSWNRHDGNQDITGTDSDGPRITIMNADAADPIARFGCTPRDSFGNAGVGSLRLPRTDNWDISFYRKIPFNSMSVWRRSCA